MVFMSLAGKTWKTVKWLFLQRPSAQIPKSWSRKENLPWSHSRQVFANGSGQGMLLPLVIWLEGASRPLSTLGPALLIGAGAGTSTLLKVWGASESLKISSLYFWAAHLEARKLFSAHRPNKNMKTNFLFISECKLNILALWVSSKTGEKSH